jgi:small subunit ribosomal protein S17
MKERGVRKKLTGVVVSDKMDKTAVVHVTSLKKHKMYRKYVTTRAKYVAHDPENSCHVGDKVRILECRPMSRSKRWQVIEIIERAKGQEPPRGEEVLTEQAG